MSTNRNDEGGCQEPSHDHSKCSHRSGKFPLGSRKICICGEKHCGGSCRDNCQCTFADMNLKSPSVVLPGGGAERYICPMRCEGDKTYPKPGDCPVCGMHLVRVISFGPPQANQDDEEIQAYQSMRKKFIIAALLSVPILVLSMGDLLPGLGMLMQSLFSKRINIIIQFLLSIPVVLLTGSFIFEKGYRSLISRNLNMFTLIALGTGVAWVYSILGLLLPGYLPVVLLDATGNVPTYFEAAAIIITLVILGQMLELRAHAQTNSAIKELLNLVPPTALVIRDGKELEVPLSELIVGDQVKVKPGEKIPVDGVLVEGSGLVDQSMITGEPIAIEKRPGDLLTGGTINTNGSFSMTAEKVGGDTLLARIIDMVNEASRSKAPIQKMADTVAGYFVPAVVLAALITILAWGLIDGRWDLGLVNSIAVIIIACPCALGLATPVSIMVGTGKGAQLGILIKNAKAIEQLRKVDTLLVDKTGTLTEGKPALTKYKSCGNYSASEILQYAASVDNQSEHPLAQSIVAKSKELDLEILEVNDFESITGMGASALIRGKPVAVGNIKLVQFFGVPELKDDGFIQERQSKGETVVFVIIEKTIAGILCVADPIKESTPEAIKKLHQQGIKVIMLTGDNELTAKSVADELGLDAYRAGCLPSDKFETVKELQNQGQVVAMAGDGINDAPALAQANVSIAMGTGTDVAMQSADITLVKGDLMGIARARSLSMMIIGNIRQNLVLAFVYNTIGIPIAALGLLNPMFSGLAMALSSISVLSNALRIRSQNLKS